MDFPHTCAIGQNAVLEVTSCRACEKDQSRTGRGFEEDACCRARLLCGSVHQSQNRTCCADIKRGFLSEVSWQTGSVPLMKPSCSNKAGVSRAGVDVVQNEVI